MKKQGNIFNTVLRSPFRGVIIWVMLLAFFLGGNITSNTFLCFGEDGHVAIEIGPCYNFKRKPHGLALEFKTYKGPGTLGSYEKGVPLSDKPLPAPVISDDDCGSCRDVPLFSDSSGYLSKLNLQAFNSLSETKFIFASYYPIEPELSARESSLYMQSRRENIPYPRLVSVNTNTTIMLN